MHIFLVSDSKTGINFFSELEERLAAKIVDLELDAIFVPFPEDIPAAVHAIEGEADLVFVFVLYEELDFKIQALLNKLIEIEMRGRVRIIKVIEEKEFEHLNQASLELEKEKLSGKWSELIINRLFKPGSFNPKEGESVPELGGHVFKIITEGIDGDDGNLYRYFLSTDPNFNIKVEGGNAFTYEYTFRLWNNSENVSHIYPFIDKGTVSVRQANFDWDSDGEIRVVSISRSGQLLKVSGQDVWEDKNEFKIFPEEVGKSLDFQFIKKKYPIVMNNNVVVRVKNQYGENMKFFTIPIGGVPKYSYSIGVQKIRK